MLHKNKLLIAIFGILLTLSACKTDKIDTPDAFNLPNGGYMRTVTPWPLNTLRFSKANLGTASNTLVLEAYDSQNGKLFSSYDMTVRFVDRTPANGNKSVAYKPFKNMAASSFSPDATTKLPRATLVLSASEMMTILGLQAADVSPNDQFEVSAVMKMSNGMSFNATNSGTNITGGDYYKSPFFYRTTVVE